MTEIPNLLPILPIVRRIASRVDMLINSRRNSGIMSGRSPNPKILNRSINFDIQNLVKIQRITKEIFPRQCGKHYYQENL